ncbi:MAG: hypothetical protein ACI9LZ_003979, partial [Glaciecola sp.]
RWAINLRGTGLDCSGYRALLRMGVAPTIFPRWVRQVGFTCQLWMCWFICARIFYGQISI